MFLLESLLRAREHNKRAHTGEFLSLIAFEPSEWKNNACLLTTTGKSHFLAASSFSIMIDIKIQNVKNAMCRP
jgi:hypothetical protein